MLSSIGSYCCWPAHAKSDLMQLCYCIIFLWNRAYVYFSLRWYIVIGQKHYHCLVCFYQFCSIGLITIVSSTSISDKCMDVWMNELIKYFLAKRDMRSKSQKLIYCSACVQKFLEFQACLFPRNQPCFLGKEGIATATACCENYQTSSFNIMEV